MAANVEYVQWRPDPTIVPELAVEVAPRTGAEAMARLQKLQEQQPRNKKSPARTTAAPATTTPRGTSQPAARSEQPQKRYSAERANRLQQHGKDSNITPVQVLISVQETLEHAMHTADEKDQPELAGPALQPDYHPVDGGVPGAPKFRTFLEQQEQHAAIMSSQHGSVAPLSAHRALSYAGTQGGSGPRASVPPIIGYGSVPSHLQSDLGDFDSVTDRLHGGARHADQDTDAVGSDAGSDAGGEGAGRRTPRRAGAAGGYGGIRGPLTPRTTVYVTNAVTARFISERYETSVRDSLQQQEYEHRLDLMLYFQQQMAATSAREHKAQLRGALEQQYLARAEVEELRGAIALRIGDIEEQARLRLEQLAAETRSAQQREISRLYGIVSAGQHAAQQQWLLGCEERERHFITSESDRLSSRLSGSFLSEQHSLQLKTMLRERIPVATSRAVADALNSVHEPPQAVRPIMQLPAQTASPQIVLKGRPQYQQQQAGNGSFSSNNNNNAADAGGGEGSELVVQQPLLQIRRQQRQAPPPRQATPPTSARGAAETDFMMDEVKPVRPPTPRAKQTTPTQQRRTVAGAVSAINADESKNKTLLAEQQQQQQQQQQQLQLQSKPRPKSSGGALNGMSQRAVTPKSSSSASAASASAAAAAVEQRAQAAASGIEMVEIDGEADLPQPSTGRAGTGRRAGPLVAAAANKRRQQQQIDSRSSLLDTEAPVPGMPKPSGVNSSELTVQETLAERRKKAHATAAAREQERMQRSKAAAAAEAARNSPVRATSGAALVDRPLPAVFHPYWGWMFRSMGALLTWQRRLFVFTSNGRLRCANSEKGPWILVTTADRILRVEVDSYHDVSGNGIAPPTTQYHQYGFYVDVLDDSVSAAASVVGNAAQEQPRQKRLRFCCFSRAELTNWMHILRRSTETVGQLSELGVPGAISPVRRRFEALAEEAARLGGAHMADAVSRMDAAHRADSSAGEENELLAKWLSQHQDAEGNAMSPPAVVPYRARVQLEDEVALLEARESKRFERSLKAAEEPHNMPIAHHNTVTSLGRPRPPHELEQYA